MYSTLSVYGRLILCWWVFLWFCALEWDRLELVSAPVLKLSPWANCLSSLSFSFSLLWVGSIIPASQFYWEKEGRWCAQSQSSVLRAEHSFNSSYYEDETTDVGKSVTCLLWIEEGCPFILYNFSVIKTFITLVYFDSLFLLEIQYNISNALFNFE